MFILSFLQFVWLLNVVFFSGALPKEIGNLKKLETLMLENNILTSLPPTIANLGNLRIVNLSGNGLKTFPMELCGLKSLDAVNLSRNRITMIPSSAVCQAIELNLNQNQVSRSLVLSYYTPTTKWKEIIWNDHQSDCKYRLVYCYCTPHDKSFDEVHRNHPVCPSVHLCLIGSFDFVAI